MKIAAARKADESCGRFPDQPRIAGGLMALTACRDVTPQ